MNHQHQVRDQPHHNSHQSNWEKLDLTAGFLRFVIMLIFFVCLCLEIFNTTNDQKIYSLLSWRKMSFKRFSFQLFMIWFNNILYFIFYNSNPCTFIFKVNKLWFWDIFCLGHITTEILDYFQFSNFIWKFLFPICPTWDLGQLTNIYEYLQKWAIWPIFTWELWCQSLIIPNFYEDCTKINPNKVGSLIRKDVFNDDL